DDVLIFAGAAAGATRSFAEGPAVADAAAIVDREHDISTASEVLIHRVGIRVVVHVVPAQQHLAHGTAMHEDQRRALVAGFGAVGEKELAVDFEAIGGAEQYLLRSDKLSGGKVARLLIGRDDLRLCPVSDGGVIDARWMRAVRADVRDICTVAKRHRTPLDSFTSRQRPWVGGVDVNDPEMAAIDVATIRIEEYDVALRGKGPLLDFAITGCEELRLTGAVSGERIQMLPAVLFAGDHQTIVGSPVENPAAGIAGHVGKRVLRR